LPYGTKYGLRAGIVYFHLGVLLNFFTAYLIILAALAFFIYMAFALAAAARALGVLPVHGIFIVI
jgi:hypothetical protein